MAESLGGSFAKLPGTPRDAGARSHRDNAADATVEAPPTHVDYVRLYEQYGPSRLWRGSEWMERGAHEIGMTV